MGATTARTRIDEAQARQIAVAAEAHPSTVKKEFATPGSVRGMAGRRVRAALMRLGYWQTDPTEGRPSEKSTGKAT